MHCSAYAHCNDRTCQVMSFFIDVFLLDDNGGLYHRSGLIRLWIHRQYFVVGFGLYMGFADNKKIIEYHQTYPETFFFPCNVSCSSAASPVCSLKSGFYKKSC